MLFKDIPEKTSINEDDELHISLDSNNEDRRIKISNAKNYLLDQDTVDSTFNNLRIASGEDCKFRILTGSTDYIPASFYNTVGAISHGLDADRILGLNAIVEGDSSVFVVGTGMSASYFWVRIGPSSSYATPVDFTVFVFYEDI